MWLMHIALLIINKTLSWMRITLCKQFSIHFSFVELKQALS